VNGLSITPGTPAKSVSVDASRSAPVSRRGRTLALLILRGGGPLRR